MSGRPPRGVGGRDRLFESAFDDVETAVPESRIGEIDPDDVHLPGVFVHRIVEVGTDIEKRIAELAHRARDGKLTIEELQGGTFTITNGGVFGSLLSTPIINIPQSAILGMHKIEERPIALNGQVVIRPMMYLALS